jgi:hypothetical protein
MWPFAILVIVTFGVTGIMTQVFTRSCAQDHALLFGENVSHAEVTSHAKRLQNFLRAMSGMMVGPLERIPYFIGEKPEDLAWNYLKFMHEARRLGITVTKEELDRAVVSWFLDLIALAKIESDIRQQYGDYGDYSSFIYKEQGNYRMLTEVQKEIYRRQNNIYFRNQDFNSILRNQLHYKQRDFMRDFADMLILDKLYRSVVASAKYTNAELYEKYREVCQERRFELAFFDPADYESEAVIDRADEKYKKQREKFIERNMRPRSVDFEYVFADKGKFRKSVEKETSAGDMELRVFFMKNRGRFWRDTDAGKKWMDNQKAKHELEKKKREGLSEEERKKLPPLKKPKHRNFFKKYDDVAGEVHEKFIEDKTDKKIKRALDSVRGELQCELAMLAREGLPPAMLTFETVEDIAQTADLTAGRSRDVSDEDASLLEDIGSFNTFNQLFEVRQWKFSGITDAAEGKFIYRVINRKGPRIPRDEVFERQLRREITRTLAIDLAKRDARSVAAAVKEGGSLRSLQADGSYITLMTPYLKRLELGGRIEGALFENKWDESMNGTLSQMILAEGFLLKEPGDFLDNRSLVEKKKKPDPIIASGDGNVFLLRFLDARDPLPNDFREKAERYQLELSLAAEKRREFFEKWKEDLDTRADLNFPGLQEKEEDESTGAENE